MKYYNLYINGTFCGKMQHIALHYLRIDCCSIRKCAADPWNFVLLARMVEMYILFVFLFLVVYQFVYTCQQNMYAMTCNIYIANSKTFTYVG